MNGRVSFSHIVWGCPPRSVLADCASAGLNGLCRPWPIQSYGHTAITGQNNRKRQIKDVCMKRKTWDTISFVIPFPRSSFLLPDIQIFGYSL